MDRNFSSSWFVAVVPRSRLAYVALLSSALALSD